MRLFLRLILMVLPVCLVFACSDTPNPTAPAEASLVPAISAAPGRPSVAMDAGGRRVLMLDQCDPDSFNAAIGPGTCINRNGGITFQQFGRLLETLHLVPSWRFSPGTIHVPGETTLPIVNAGGEVHTFTEVEEFGGGIVPLLNNLSGNTVVAPECLALAPGDFIPPGGKATHTFAPGEHEKYQCCIHPWMRATTR